jgi:outer membrane biosynthesis protein TonB
VKSIALASIVLISAIASFAQAPQPTATQTPEKVFAFGAGISAPELLPHATTKPYIEDHCKGDEAGKVTFALIIDANGEPRNVYFLGSIGDDLDVLALKHVLEDRFKPGAKDGKPVAIAASIEVSLRTCLRDEKDAQGKQQVVLHLASEPQQRLTAAIDPPQQVVLVSGTGLSPNPSNPDAGILTVGGDIKAPVEFPPAPSTNAAVQRLLGGGVYKVSVVVDRYGMPERARILDAEQPGREQQVSGIIRLWRFKPALRNGEPVPVRTEVKINSR